ncbi:LiaI-LiaF-like domain-containing protein [Pedobacter alpinus]|uniref:LiaI-LiaF-like domain-containing protein n=1 Tax=Pedobacter alpinus TaxID=1590643 RepID=A0ABW5TMH8_9SPHI
MKADKIFWGIVFIFVGTVFLLENFGVIDFSWRDIWRFWPLLLVITGVNIVFKDSKSNTGVIIIVLITTATLAFLTFKGLTGTQKTDDVPWEWSHNEDEVNNEENKEFSTNIYNEDYNAKYKNATLSINGGASKFSIESGSEKLFESKIKETISRYYLKKTDTDSTVVLSFNSKNKKNGFNFKDTEFSDVKIKLHTQPTWDVNLNMGAGKVNFDLSNNKINTINLKGGAADFNIKLGSLSEQINLNAETGIAKVSIEIPQDAACEIKTSTGLSSKDFEDFVKKSDGIYVSPNFDTAKNKIYINLKGGLSDFEVTRY